MTRKGPIPPPHSQLSGENNEVELQMPQELHTWPPGGKYMSRVHARRNIQIQSSRKSQRGWE